MDHIGINKSMWELTADIHRRECFADALQQVQDPDFTTFDEVEHLIFSTAIDVRGKHIIQIGCSNGTELINLKRQGAGHCLGVDLSEKFIEQARELSKAAGAELEFEHANIYDLQGRYLQQFDLVHITVGVLGWMPDLSRFVGLIAQFLKPQGQVFMYEQHPILGMFNPEPPHPMDASYFRKEPFRDEIVPEYIDRSGQHKAVSYWFPHTLGDLLSCCSAHGLTLTHFKEYPHDLSDNYEALERDKVEMPMSFTLIAQKA